jgi:hypothetical protein
MQSEGYHSTRDRSRVLLDAVDELKFLAEVALLVGDPSESYLLAHLGLDLLAVVESLPAPSVVCGTARVLDVPTRLFQNSN